MANPSPVQAAQTLAWKSRRLTFDRALLADVVAEINRYNVRQIVIADSTLATMEIAGSVQSDNTDGFVLLLENGFGIVAERKGDEIVLKKAR